jgi:hypothetical protein
MHSAIEMSMEIRELVMIMSFPVVVLSVLLMVKRGVFQGHAQIINTILFIGLIIAMIRVYPVAVLSATDCVRDSSSSVSEQIEKGLDVWANSKIAGEDSTFNITAKVTKVFYNASLSLSSIVRSFLIFGQRVALYVLIALSPLLLALMLIKETSSISVKFIMTTIGIILWSVGFNLSDMMIYAGWDSIIHAAINSPGEVAALGGTGIAGGLISGAAVTQSLPVLTIGLAFMIAFYFLVGIIVFNVLGIMLIMRLLHGGDPTGTAMGAVSSTSSLVNGSVNTGRMGLGIASKLGKGQPGATVLQKALGGLSKIGRGQSGV